MGRYNLPSFEKLSFSEVLILEQLGVLGSHVVFSFPCSLFDSMVSPKNFNQCNSSIMEYLDISCQNLNGLILITQVLINLQWFKVNYMRRVGYILPQHKDMECIMNYIKRWRQRQTISNEANSLKYIKGSYKMWT